MKREIAFSFEELKLDRKDIIETLGYSENSFFEPFPTYLDEAFKRCHQLSDIRGAFQIYDMDENCSGKNSIYIQNLEFSIGKTIKGELKGADSIGFFVCTAGAEISKLANKLLKGEDPVLGYVYDVVGSAIAEAVGDKAQSMVQQYASEQEKKITNRYSPGYCHWNITDQHKLFSLFGGSICNVRLTPSALMEPVKSISGLIGIGKEVEFHDYRCNLCHLDNCIYRENIGLNQNR